MRTATGAREPDQPASSDAAEPPKPKSLATKLAEVMGAVSHVEKRGVNDYHKYKYATEADVAAAVRKELAQRSVIMVPNLVDYAEREMTTQKGQVEYVSRVTMEYTLIDGETGERLSFRMPGAGQDRGDKGLFKAITGSEKYALLKLFLLPTGDDPEGDTDADKRNAEIATITPEQRSDVEALIEETQTEPSAFCEFFHIKATGDLPATEYGRAIRSLEAKLKKMKGKA